MPNNLEKKNKKVFVAMSGGVDSSVTAALLKKEGYDVTGVFIKVWSADRLGTVTGKDIVRGEELCGWKEDRLDAMRVCALLDLSFLTFDLEKEYKTHIVDYMIKEYERGNTPNPDVMCNKYIKFGAFFKKARAEGADFIATGHHVQNISENRSIKLLKGIDKEKDQSYFLWPITQDELRYTLFPIGQYTKTNVRKMAAEIGLPTACKKDSQGLCFVGKLDIKTFLKQHIKTARGNVLNEKKEIIGYHDGAVLYTLGERHGFTITQKSPDTPPLYVVSKDTDANILIVSPGKPDQKKERGVREIKIVDTNWIAENPTVDKNYTARLRYRQPVQKCRIKEIAPSGARIVFEDEQWPVASGQSLVLYDDEICVGGGVIV